MTSREFLQQPYKLHRRIERGLERIEMFKSLAQNGHAPSSGDSGGGGGGSALSRSYIEVQTLRYVDVEEEVKRNTEEFLQISALVRKSIYDINNLEIEDLLELRYLNFRSWQQISDELVLTKNYLCKLHKKGLELVKVPEKIEEKGEENK